MRVPERLPAFFMSKLPHAHLDTSSLSSADAFEQWRGWVSVVFDTVSELPDDGRRFEASMDNFLLGQLVLGDTRCSEGTYSRSRAKISQDGMDGILVQYFLEGETQFGVDRHSANVLTGDITIFDLAQPMENFNTAYRHYTVAVPRELLTEHGVDVAWWHGKRLPREAGLTRMLVNHLHSLFACCPDAPVEAGVRLQDATVQLTAAALNHPRGAAGPSLDLLQRTILEEIKRYIRAHLTAPELSAASIARHFGMSRATLYRMTEYLGGVMNYARQQRLEGARRDLESPQAAHLNISAIAFKWGFESVNTFTRNFKARYGLLPRELREQMKQADADEPAGALITAGFDDWMRTMMR